MNDGDHDRTADLRSITERLGAIGQQLGQTSQDIVSYLVEREHGTSPLPAAAAGAAPPLAAALDERFALLRRQLDGIRDRLDGLGQMLEHLTSRGPAEAAAPAAKPALPPGLEEALKTLAVLLKQKFDGIEQRDAKALAALERIEQGFDERLQTLVAQVAAAPAMPEPEPAPAFQELYVPPPQPQVQAAPVAAGAADWQRAILGHELASNPALDYQRQQLCNQVLGGDAASCALAGQLLVFQSASAERMPQLLKDVGEAYYRWQPKAFAGPNPMETALAHWLERCCETAGVYNKIELVSLGERFDAARHNATTRGVEVSEVHGWVVLRDNGKVYTKAAVAVR